MPMARYGMLVGEAGHRVLRDQLPRQGGDQGAKDQVDHDVHEIVQARLHDVRDALADGPSLRRRIVVQPAGELLGTASGISSLLPCLRYCQSTIRLVPMATR